MSGCPSCALIDPSMNSTSECTTLCGWMDTVTCSSATPKRWWASITSTLVHERRGVDGDLRAHRPSGVIQRLLDGDLVQVEVRVRPERPSARGEDQAADTVAALAPQALPDDAVLGVDRPDSPLPRGPHDERTGHD